MIFRKAKIQDVLAMQLLINNYASAGMMLSKPLVAIYENLRDFIVVEDDGAVVGVGALHILWEDLAEVRSLAVRADYAGQGIGKKIVAKLEEEAYSLGLTQVFALTYQIEFFTKSGYVEVDREQLPQKVWKDCINCPKFPNCDEYAVVKNLQ